MSNPWHRQGVNPPAAEPAASRHRPIAVFGDNADVKRAVDRLSNLGFPVERAAVIGDDLKMVEQVTGGLNRVGAALKGAVTHDGPQPATTTVA